MTPVESNQLSDGLTSILEAFSRFQRAADDRYATKEDHEELVGKVDSLSAAIEEVRRNAKGANNWGKIASGAAALVPIATAFAKAQGWF